MIHITAILVLYNTKLQESQTFISLSKADDLLNIHLLVFDNSPFVQFEDSDFELNGIKITYKSDIHNSGLASAYNWAVDYSLSKSIDWLLLLDQDTQLPENFFVEIQKVLVQVPVKKDESIVSIIPFIRSNGRIASPTIMKTGGYTRKINQQGNSIITHKQATAINSCNLVRVSFIEQIGGFTLDFPLDMLDHWFFRTLHKKGKSIFLMNNSIEHALSVFANEYVTIQRYKRILTAEHDYFTKLNKPLEPIIYGFRLVFRFLKHFLTAKFSYSNLSLTFLFKLLKTIILK